MGGGVTLRHLQAGTRVFMLFQHYTNEGLGLTWNLSGSLEQLKKKKQK